MLFFRTGGGLRVQPEFDYTQKAQYSNVAVAERWSMLAKTLCNAVVGYTESHVCLATYFFVNQAIAKSWADRNL